ncbi:MAG: SxtJ family membrane protein [Acidobacteriota bacterium]|jgi:hypothetical protein
MSDRTYKVDRPSTAQCRDAALAATLILLLIGYFGQRQEFVLAAIAVLVVAMLAPRIFRPWAFVWWGLSRALATVGSRVMLTLIWLVLVVPIGRLRRLTGADPMRAREWRGQGSVFVERDGKLDPKDLEVPY